ncbi:MAG: hypothetical protein H7061_01920 [Bdellovibrionaceae bacterium]|nr:hypothetical protein [Bdellovibrio sp.]
MKSKEKSLKSGASLQRLSLSVGNFIRYWGFRRIHGAVWTQLYLSKTPLSCADLTRKLGLSKSLISPALEELCQYQLIRETPAPNNKTKLYVAKDNINEVIRHVLRTREAKILKQITQDFSAFKISDGNSDHLNKQRVNSLEGMILGANTMLEIMLSQNDLMNLPLDFGK